MTDKQNVRFEDEAYTLIRKPLDPGTGQPLEKCGYALFPGTALAQSEPELVILMYDSILHQHPDTAMSYNNIGLVYNSQGDYDQALEYCQKALEIFEKALGAEHPYTKTVKENIELLKTKMEE